MILVHDYFRCVEIHTHLLRFTLNKLLLLGQFDFIMVMMVIPILHHTLINIALFYHIFHQKILLNLSCMADYDYLLITSLPWHIELNIERKWLKSFSIKEMENRNKIWIQNTGETIQQQLTDRNLFKIDQGFHHEVQTSKALLAHCQSYRWLIIEI